jgi:hypothetical protein
MAEQAEQPLPEIRFAEWPQRRCRQPMTADGLIDHWCDLAELHPGPCCPRTHAPSIRQRHQWEQANPGWEKLRSHDDPFADLTQRLQEGQ